MCPRTLGQTHFQIRDYIAETYWRLDTRVWTFKVIFSKSPFQSVNFSKSTFSKSSSTSQVYFNISSQSSQSQLQYMYYFIVNFSKSIHQVNVLSPFFKVNISSQLLSKSSFVLVNKKNVWMLNHEFKFLTDSDAALLNTVNKKPMIINKI